MATKFNFKIRPIKNSDRNWVRKFIAKRWGSEKIVSRGKIYHPYTLPGFVGLSDKKYLGLITYNIEKGNCEIISLDSILGKRGIGTGLVKKVEKVAQKSRCKRIWLITTNDNINALRFWQKRSFFIKNVYPDSISLSRKLKPEIPLIGNYGIPLRDEIELEKIIKKKHDNQNFRR